MHEVQVGRVARGHPDVRAHALDGDGRVLEQAAKEARLHEHQHHRECDTRERDEEAQLVVKQHLPGEIDHGFPLPNAGSPSAASSAAFAISGVRATAWQPAYTAARARTSQGRNSTQLSAPGRHTESAAVPCTMAHTSWATSWLFSNSSLTSPAAIAASTNWCRKT